MINYDHLNDLLSELKRVNSSVDYNEFMYKKLGRSTETFKTTQLLREKLLEDGLVKKTPQGDRIILTAKGAEFAGYNAQQPVVNKSKGDYKTIFVSHSFQDRGFAERIIDHLLVNIFNLDKKKDIFFTSKRESGIAPSLPWKNVIKSNLQDCDIFIAIISTGYHQSQMCLAELGAAWALEKKTYPIIVPPIKASGYSKVIDLQASSIIRHDEILSFIQHLSDELENKTGKTADLTNIDSVITKFITSTRNHIRNTGGMVKDSIPKVENQVYLFNKSESEKIPVKALSLKDYKSFLKTLGNNYTSNETMEMKLFDQLKTLKYDLDHLKNAKKRYFKFIPEMLKDWQKIRGQQYGFDKYIVLALMLRLYYSNNAIGAGIVKELIEIAENWEKRIE